MAVLSGCTGDSSDGSTAPTETTGGEATDDQASATSIPLSEGFCGAAEPVVELLGADTPDDMKAFYEQLPEVRQVLTDEAPEQLADAVEEFLAGVDAARPALEASGYDPTSLDAEQIDGFASGKVQAAGAAIVQYVDETCLGNPPVPDEAPTADVPADEQPSDGSDDAEVS